MDQLLDRMHTAEDGTVFLEIDHVVYKCTPIDVLDENLKSCLSSHRDILLDARIYLYKKDK